MRVIETKVYKFNELSDEVKEKAIEKLYDLNIGVDWWDAAYMDAENVGIQIKEFDIGRGQSIKIDFGYNTCYNVASKIISDHGEMCETHKDAKEFIKDYDNKVYELSDKKDTEKVAEGNEDKFDKWLDNREEEYMSDLRHEYLKFLRADYEYLTSEAAIVETIECNEYEFTEEGELI